MTSFPVFSGEFGSTRRSDSIRTPSASSGTPESASMRSLSLPDSRNDDEGGSTEGIVRDGSTCSAVPDEGASMSTRSRPTTNMEVGSGSGSYGGSANIGEYGRGDAMDGNGYQLDDTS